jgi:uncharacterized membrane protein YphA (DoxX/SURF4 family)
MKIAALIARILLGLVFLVFGLNGFLNFIPMGPMPTGNAGQFVGALIASRMMYFVSAVQLIGGALLLVNQFVPLALTILGPVLVNILLFHALMAPAGLPLAIVVAILWFILFFRYSKNFAGLFEQKPTLP